MKFHLPTINQFASLMVINITNAIFQLLLIPLLIHNSDNEKLGTYFIVLSYSVLASILINFGTSQTAVVDIRKAETTSDKETILAETLAIRTLPFIFAIIVTLIVATFVNNGFYFIWVLPVLLSEYINPQFFLIATYHLQKYTIYNLLLRMSLIIGLYLFRSNPNLIEITIVGMGTITLLLHGYYLPTTFFKKGVLHKMPTRDKLKKLIKTNSLVVGNGMTVQLQQSLFLFALPTFATPIFISAYGFIDKLISSFRMFINAYSSAVMPHAAGTHQAGFDHWIKLKQQQNKLLTIFCIIAGVIMYFFPAQLLTILLIGKNNEASFFSEATQLMKMISLVPLLIALNVLNVAELILEKKFIAYFVAGLFILLVTIVCITAFQWGLPEHQAGFYPMVIEGFCLITYMVIVKKQRNAK